MKEAKLRILRMLAEHQISAEQAEQLLAALGEEAESEDPAGPDDVLAGLIEKLAGLFGSGWGFGMGCGGRHRHVRVHEMSAPICDDGILIAETRNGRITAQGAGVDACQVIARISARAATREEAEDLARRVELEFGPSGRTMTVHCRKPEVGAGQSIDISLDVTVPVSTGLQLKTHNGGLKVSDLAGDLDLVTHNGTIKADRVSGAMKGRTHNGSVKVTYLAAPRHACDVCLATHNGTIVFSAPEVLSAQVRAVTHNGSVRTELPISVQGKVASRLEGTIGTGKGRLDLETHNGSIRIAKLPGPTATEGTA